MKAKTKNKTKRLHSKQNSTRTLKSNGPRKTVEDRGLNEDEQDQVTNVEKEEEQVAAPENSSRDTGFTVEEEEEREKRRKAEDVNAEEPMK
ncbi:MAG TPA: hypothetical protein VK589_29400 [Chryseolinea sp.]|nr:hypothetical protein [Chryseolinea sp.]